MSFAHTSNIIHWSCDWLNRSYTRLNLDESTLIDDQDPYTPTHSPRPKHQSKPYDQHHLFTYTPTPTLESPSSIIVYPYPHSQNESRINLNFGKKGKNTDISWSST